MFQCDNIAFKSLKNTNKIKSYLFQPQLDENNYYLNTEEAHYSIAAKKVNKHLCACNRSFALPTEKKIHLMQKLHWEATSS